MDTEKNRLISLWFFYLASNKLLLVALNIFLVKWIPTMTLLTPKILLITLSTIQIPTTTDFKMNLPINKVPKIYQIMNFLQISSWDHVSYCRIWLLRMNEIHMLNIGQYMINLRQVGLVHRSHFRLRCYLHLRIMCCGLIVLHFKFFVILFVLIMTIPISRLYYLQEK